MHTIQKQVSSIMPDNTDKFIIRGGAPLKGSVHINGSKNSALALIAAGLTASEPITLSNVPPIGDVEMMLDILEEIGCRIEWTAAETVVIDPSRITCNTPSATLVSQMRASFNVLGPLAMRCGETLVPLPGGCNLGDRKLDFHIDGLNALGIECVEVKELNAVHAVARNPRGAYYRFPSPSVTGTTHLMSTACLVPGNTVLDNVALEPEIVDLARMLNLMGARIHGAGTPTINIEGVDRLTGTTYKAIPDRIEAGTFAVAAAMTRGEITLENVVVEHLTAALLTLSQIGAIVTLGGAPQPHSASTLAQMFEAEGRDDTTAQRGLVNVHIQAPEKPKATTIITHPYPYFPTDLQPQFGALLSIAEGCSLIRENLFNKRFGYLDQIQKMGGHLSHDRDLAAIMGVPTLRGTTVKAEDLRGGAALVLAGLAAEGTTVVEDVYHIDRGYHCLVEKLQSLGADIQRVKTPAAAPVTV